MNFLVVPNVRSCFVRYCRSVVGKAINTEQCNNAIYITLSYDGAILEGLRHGVTYASDDPSVNLLC